MLTFSQFLKEQSINEMPHLQVGDKFYDLELEVHSKMTPKEFVRYIEDWVSGKPISSKKPGFTMQVNASSIKEFARKVLAQPYLKNFTIAYYGEETWQEVETVLRSKM